MFGLSKKFKVHVNWKHNALFLRDAVTDRVHDVAEKYAGKGKRNYTSNKTTYTFNSQSSADGFYNQAQKFSDDHFTLERS